MDSRRARYRRLRNLYLYGSDDDTRVRRNKLAEFVETSAAYIYLPENVRFGVAYPPKYGDRWLEEQDVMGDEIHRLFHDTKAALIYGLMVEWALVLDSVIGKVLVSENQPVLEVIPDTADFGVWRENLDDLDSQEAMLHQYELDLAAFTRMVRSAIPDPKVAEEIVREGEDAAVPGTAGGTNLAPGVPRILLAQASPRMIGAVQNINDTVLANPQVQGKVVRLNELWVRDDRAIRGADKDGWEWEWRKVTHLPTTERILWETLNPLLPQRHPFRQLCLMPVLGYLWGLSPLERLLTMQQWGEDKITKHDRLLNLQLDPPIALIGMSNIPEERAKLLRVEGGTFTMPAAPGADVKRLAPETPPDAAGMTKLIDEWFDRAGGLPHGSAGQTDPNMRSAGQMGIGAILSSPRTNRRAMRAEDTLEDIATDMLRLQRRVSTDPLRIPMAETNPETGGPYREVYLSQMPGDFVVRVSAHSASPLYANESRQVAQLLMREKAIDLETFVELVNPALMEIIRAKARRKQKAMAEAQERQLKLAETKVTALAEKERAQAAKAAGDGRGGQASR